MTAYGWWLPNDPRGSTSHYIQSDVLKELGELHFGRKRIQPQGREIRTFYNRAEDLLQHDLLTFDGRAGEIVCGAFGDCIRENHYTCYAGVQMFDHTHLCIRKHKHLTEEMIEQFQAYSAKALRTAGFRASDHPVWAGEGWKVYLDEPNDVHRTVRYIEQNPVKMRGAVQRHSWVTPYDNWPFHRRRAHGA